MFSGQFIWVSLGLFAIAQGNWVYDWPYGSNGECRCKKIDIQTGYADEETCLQAFSGEPYEYCYTESGGTRLGGITESDCAKYAVSNSATQTNMDCEVDCVRVVVGTMTQSDFFTKCKLETVAESGSSVSPAPSSCFVNYVLGHADFNPSKLTDASLQPLKSFSEVESAAKCQSLCQQLPECAWFQWRATADDRCNTPNGAIIGFQNEPFTCELYDYNFVKAVMNFDVKTIDDHDMSHYAGGVCDAQEFENQGCSDLFKTSSWSPFAPVQCLSCECEPRCAFKSFSHISGPAYCGKDIVTDVCSIVPPVPHTTPQPTTHECTTRECTTRECTTPECTTPVPTTATGTGTGTGTATATTESTTMFTTKHTRPPTQPIHTTTPKPTRPPTQPIHTTSPGETTTPHSTTPHTTDYTELTSTTKWRSTTPAPDTTTGFSTATTTTGFATTTTGTTGTATTRTGTNTGTATTGTGTGTETGTTEDTTSGFDTTGTTDTTTHPSHQTTNSPCPCPDCDDCPCEDCLDANWEPQDLVK